MCPEPDFASVYRSLIKSFRLAPELDERQLSAILQRYCSARHRQRNGQHSEKKGDDAG